MYPAELLALFPPYPLSHRIFVAMSFDRQFDRLWSDVIEPAISAIASNGTQLQAHRVNLTRKSDSIITEIVQEIAHCRLILADISTVGWQRRRLRKVRPIRNANVMYEVGIAHASRLPEEVLLVRGDTDPLDFDVAGVRVHQYPAHPAAAMQFLQELVKDALASVDQRRSIAVQHALRSLNPIMYLLLHSVTDIPHPAGQTVGEILASQQRLDAIQRLLSEGMLEAVYKPLPVDFMERPVAELISYRRTEFGAEVYRAARRSLGFNDALEAWFGTPAGKTWLHDFAKGARGQSGSGDA